MLDGEGIPRTVIFVILIREQGLIVELESCAEEGQVSGEHQG